MIHIRHTNARFFYCKIPVPYLRNIAKYGHDYADEVPQPKGVKLEHTELYQLRDPVPRQEFLVQLYKLITYLTSGNCHVPFLLDYKQNPLKTVLSCHIEVDGRMSGKSWTFILLMNNIGTNLRWIGNHVNIPWTLSTPALRVAVQAPQTACPISLVCSQVRRRINCGSVVSSYMIWILISMS